MKNLYKLLAITLVAVIGFSFTACGDDDNGGGSNPSLVGTWVEDNVPYNMLLEMTIFSNGTVEVKINGIRADTGTITTSDNRYTINSTAAGTRTGTFSISGNKLTWIEDGKSTQTFTRKK